MNFFISNLWGLLALFSIPTLILIYFFKRKSKKTYINTQFLIERVLDQNKGGSKFERFYTPLTFWLQLLILIILCILILDLHKLRDDSLYKICIIYDESASMQAFKKEAIQATKKILTQTQKKSRKIEIFLESSILKNKKYYHGSNISDAIKSLEKWTPSSNSHNYQTVIKSKRALLKKNGLLIFITDHKTKNSSETSTSKSINLPIDDYHHYSIGKPTNNIGFTGLSIIEKNKKKMWQTFIRNYSTKKITTNYSMEIDGQSSKPRNITLNPNSWKMIQGIFPFDNRINNEKNKQTKNEDIFDIGSDQSKALEWKKMALSLEDPEGLKIDNYLPLIQPEQKKINLSLYPNDFTGYKNTTTLKLNQHILNKFIDKICSSFDYLHRKKNIKTTNPKKTDIVIYQYNPLSPRIIDHDSIIFLQNKSKKKKFLSGNYISEMHPLTENLNWGNLLISNNIALSANNNDEPILWLDDKLIIFKKNHTSGSQSLVFNFNMNYSNAIRLPSFIIIINRFINNLRNKKPAYESKITECNQPLFLDIPNLNKSDIITLNTWSKNATENNKFNLDKKTINHKDIQNLHTPKYPAHFELLKNGNIYLRGITVFMDTKEANLTNAQTNNTEINLPSETIEKNFYRIKNWRLIMLATLILLLYTWIITTKQNTAYQRT